MCYNHRNHAGNAGDVWKHFILAEVAEYLLAREKKLVYVESHVGYPEYSLEGPGEWQDGIGSCWQRLNALKKFSYFSILDQMNPGELRNYPGSASIVLRLASKAGFTLEADVWDINPDVTDSWNDINHLRSNKFRFHLGDGFLGVRSLIDKSEPALLLIDPPFLERRDHERAVDLLGRAVRSGWTVLWWCMMDAAIMPDDTIIQKAMNTSDVMTMPDATTMQDICSNLEQYFVNFAKVGLCCGKWSGAIMALVGDSDLRGYVNQRAQSFMKTMQPP